MPNITAPISLSDGLATPVARSFVPNRVDPELSRFFYKVLPLRASWVSLEVKWSDSSPKRPTVRQDLTIDYPLIRNNATTGLDELRATARAFVNFVIPDDMLDQEIKDLRAFTVNAINNASIQAGIVSREPLWG
jgi:hypothetical protein